MNSAFIIPDSSSGGKPSEWDLSPSAVNVWVKRGSVRNQIRYRLLGKDHFQVERWFEYTVKSKKGVLGKPRSVRVALYHMRRAKKNNTWYYFLSGDAELWYFDGTRRAIRKYAPDKAEDYVGSKTTYSAEFNESGKLLSLEDTTRGNNNPRIVRISRGDGVPTITHWRGRYHEKILGNGYTDSWAVSISRNDNGAPLDNNGDWATRTYDKNGAMLSEEHCVAGAKHGFERDFNKFGRVIRESYWHKGVQIPEWVYLDPASVTPDEITSETDDGIREAMIELQGKEAFQIRMMARGPRAIVRARITEAEAEEMSAAKVSRPKLTEV